MAQFDVTLRFSYIKDKLDMGAALKDIAEHLNRDGYYVQVVGFRPTCDEDDDYVKDKADGQDIID